VDLQIGTRTGDTTETFSDLADIEVDAAGRIYLLDRQAQCVRVFSPGGMYVRTIGRRGQGPGEFHGATGMTLDATGRLWVLNQGNLRYSVFDSAGSLVAEWPRRFTNIRSAEWVSVFGLDGELREAIFYPDPVVRVRTALIRYDTLTRTPVDTTPVAGVPEGTPFGWAYRVLTARGWWSGVANRYRIWHTTYRRDTVRIITKVHPQTGLSEAERDSAERHARDLRRRATGTAPQLETRARPLFRGLVVDDLEYLWVVLSEPGDVDSTDLDVFDPSGRFLGTVTVSPRIAARSPMVIRGAHLYFVAKDELDVPFLVRATIRGRS
jgi:hypothetical protein